jgi:guanylate kinase
MSSRLLFVIAAPSGAGKTSLVNAVIKAEPHLSVCVSHTTRPIRPGEIDGVNYHFIDIPTFSKMVDADEFVEHAEVFGNCYGTARSSLDTHHQDTDILLEIDWQGAEQVQAAFPDAVSIFVLPPSLTALLARLRKRGQDSPSVIARRTALAHEELTHYVNFGYLVVNDEFATATADIQAIVRAERTRIDQARGRHRALLDELLHTR